MRRRPVTRVPRSVPVGTYRRTLQAVRSFRLNFMFGLLIALYALLLGRLFQLQVVEADAYRAKAQERRFTSYRFRAKRGLILDRHGHVLAEPKPCVRVDIDPHPKVVRNPRAFAMALSSLLGGEPSPGAIFDRIRLARENAAKEGKPIPRWIPLVRKIDDPIVMDRLVDLASRRIADKIRMDLWGTLIEPVEGRRYPNGTYAAHVLGRVPFEGVLPEGAEGAFDAALRGEDARGTTSRDGSGRRLSRPGDIDRKGERGRDVSLTLDIVVQHHLETAMQAMMREHRSLEAAGVVLDPRSGEVLAMASYPTFDPNLGVTRMNLATQGLYEPGSLFKPFTVAFALHDGKIAHDELIDMPRQIVLPQDPHPISDTHLVDTGTIRLLLSESSNTGSAWLAHQLGPQRMQRWLEHVFPYRWVEGRRSPLAGTGVGLPWERGYHRARKARAMTPHEGHRAGFGQGVALTPMQMAAGFCAFARDDARIVRPRIVRPGVDPARDARPLVGPRVCDPRHLPPIRDGLEDCVAVGTAKGAFEGCQWSAAGKTATAEQRCRASRRDALLRPDSLREGSAYKANNCGFVAYAPARSPQLVVLIMAKQLDEEKLYGGNVAGPAVRQVFDEVLAYWAVPRDQDRTIYADPSDLEVVRRAR